MKAFNEVYGSPKAKVYPQTCRSNYNGKGEILNKGVRAVLMTENISKKPGQLDKSPLRGEDFDDPKTCKYFLDHDKRSRSLMNHFSLRKKKKYEPWSQNKS